MRFSTFAAIVTAANAFAPLWERLVGPLENDHFPRIRDTFSPPDSTLIGIVRVGIDRAVNPGSRIIAAAKASLPEVF